MLRTQVCDEFPARNALVNIQLISCNNHPSEITSQDAIVSLFNFKSHIYAPTVWVKKKKKKKLVNLFFTNPW